MTLLDIVLFLPLIGFLLLLLVPKSNPNASRMGSLILSLLIFVLSLGLVSAGSANGFSFTNDIEWIHSPSIHYHIGIDGITLWLVLLSTLLTPIAILVSWKSIDHRVKEFFAFLLLLEFGLIGVFVSLDLFVFYVFWEVALVPMYFLIGIWGHDRRIYAAVKFFLYTMAGSVLMLAAIIYLYNLAGTFDYITILSQMQSGKMVFTPTTELLLFLAFFIAFAIKVPLFPLHTWLPDAHVEAPTAGSIMLASVMLKMGTYGLLRFCLPMFPAAAPSLRKLDRGPRHLRHRLRSAGRTCAAKHEEAGGVLFGQSLGLRGSRNLLVHAAGARRSRVSDAESRHLDRRAVHAGRLLV